MFNDNIKKGAGFRASEAPADAVQALPTSIWPSPSDMPFASVAHL